MFGILRMLRERRVWEGSLAVEVELGLQRDGVKRRLVKLMGNFRFALSID
jgi:hypothetical protein